MKSSKRSIVIVLLVCIAFVACRNKQKQTEQTPVDTVTIAADTSNINEIDEALPDFPKVADKVENLIPKGYKIDLEADGDLNNDGSEDKVIVLLNTTDTTALRPTLILLNKAKVYEVNAISYAVVEPKFRDDGYKIYDYEEVSIDSGKLIVTMQGTGPYGSIESTFKYLKNELTLTCITTFNMGAGGQTEQKFDLIKGIYQQTDINTMKEDMPSETTTKKYKIPKMLFKDSSPSEIMIEAFKKVGH